MDKFNINDLNTQGGKIKFTKSLYTKPLNKQFLISKLGDFLRISVRVKSSNIYFGK